MLKRRISIVTCNGKKCLEVSAPPRAGDKANGVVGEIAGSMFRNAPTMTANDHCARAPAQSAEFYVL